MSQKILVVEDELEVLEGISILLEESGYIVMGLSDGGSLGETLDEFAPDLILMDIWLPGRSGVRLAQDLKLNDLWSEVPIILMSAKEEVDIRAAEAGADDYVSKPFASKVLLEKIEALLSEHPNGFENWPQDKN